MMAYGEIIKQIAEKKFDKWMQGADDRVDTEIEMIVDIFETTTEQVQFSVAIAFNKIKDNK